jgi:glycerate kinase
LIAFDKFKDSLTAQAAGEITHNIGAELHSDWTFDLCPLADGGEGFSSILTASVSGTWHEADVSGPLRTPSSAGFGLVDVSRLPKAVRQRLDLGHLTKLAVIEMASASGIQSLPPSQRDPWQTDTGGTGQLIRAAIEAGAEAVLLGLGGSATHDLGLGALLALGWRAEDIRGNELTAVHPASWAAIHRLVPSDARLPPIRIACDVSNPLLGPRGAATVFGPQKGLKPADLPRLESESARIAQLLGQATQRPGLEATPGAGAAGGIAFGFLTAADARLVPGFDLVEEWLDLARKVEAADLIITGEGRFDESSLEGKGPGTLARRGAELGKPVMLFAGSIDIASPPVGCKLVSITPPGTELSVALATAAQNLAAAVRQSI